MDLAGTDTRGPRGPAKDVEATRDKARINVERFIASNGRSGRPSLSIVLDSAVSNDYANYQLREFWTTKNTLRFEKSPEVGVRAHVFPEQVRALVIFRGDQDIAHQVPSLGMRASLSWVERYEGA